MFYWDLFRPYSNDLYRENIWSKQKNIGPTENIFVFWFSEFATSKNTLFSEFLCSIKFWAVRKRQAGIESQLFEEKITF